MTTVANGNALICHGAAGRFFQQTKDNKIVWEYVNPYIPAEFMQGAVFKINGYAPDYCPQFKNLAPAKGPATQPPDNAQFSVKSARRTPILLLSILSASSIAFFSFLLGWKLSRKRSG